MTGDVIQDRSDHFDGQLHVVCPCGSAYVRVACVGGHLDGNGIVPSMTFRCEDGHSFPVSFVFHEGFTVVEVGQVIDLPDGIGALRALLESDPIVARPASAPLTFRRDAQIIMAPAAESLPLYEDLLANPATAAQTAMTWLSSTSGKVDDDLWWPIVRARNLLSDLLSAHPAEVNAAFGLADVPPELERVALPESVRRGAPWGSAPEGPVCEPCGTLMVRSGDGHRCLQCDARVPRKLFDREDAYPLDRRPPPTPMSEPGRLVEQPSGPWRAVVVSMAGVLALFALLAGLGVYLCSCSPPGCPSGSCDGRTGSGR